MKQHRMTSIHEARISGIAAHQNRRLDLGDDGGIQLEAQRRASVADGARLHKHHNGTRQHGLALTHEHDRLREN
jgi:hypothetical protein